MHRLWLRGHRRQLRLALQRLACQMAPHTRLDCDGGCFSDALSIFFFLNQAGFLTRPARSFQPRRLP